MIRIVISTDIATNGVNFPAVDHVIQYDLPSSAEEFHTYMRRISFAGCDGKPSLATSLFVSDTKSMNILPKLISLLKASDQPIPVWMHEIRSNANKVITPHSSECKTTAIKVLESPSSEVDTGSLSNTSTPPLRTSSTSSSAPSPKASATTVTKKFQRSRMHPSHYSSHAMSSANRQCKKPVKSQDQFQPRRHQQDQSQQMFRPFSYTEGGYIGQTWYPPCAPPSQTASDYYIMQYYPQYVQAAAAAAAAATTTGGSAVVNGSGTYGYTPHATQPNPQQYSYQTMYSIPEQGNGQQQQQPSGGSG